MINGFLHNKYILFYKNPCPFYYILLQFQSRLQFNVYLLLETPLGVI